MPCAKSTSAKHVGKARDAANASGAARANAPNTHDPIDFDARASSAIEWSSSVPANETPRKIPNAGTAKRYAPATFLKNAYDARSAKNNAAPTSATRSARAWSLVLVTSDAVL